MLSTSVNDVKDGTQDDNGDSVLTSDEPVALEGEKLVKTRRQKSRAAA
jgi:hypothetical protein